MNERIVRNKTVDGRKSFVNKGRFCEIRSQNKALAWQFLGFEKTLCFKGSSRAVDSTCLFVKFD